MVYAGSHYFSLWALGSAEQVVGWERLYPRTAALLRQGRRGLLWHRLWPQTRPQKQEAVGRSEFWWFYIIFICFHMFWLLQFPAWLQNFQTKFWCQPEITGVGCEGGPATLPVCGMCGILSDSVYPEGVSAMWDRRSCLRQPATVSRQSMFLIWNIIQEYLQIFFSPHRGWIAIVWWIVGCDALIPVSLQ